MGCHKWCILSFTLLSQGNLFDMLTEMKILKYSTFRESISLIAAGCF